jgi:EmrB/QacA subfamily drug resistance transporter
MTPAYETELQRRRWYALAIMSIGSFMTPFDASIVAVALPAMGADLHLSYSQGLWAQAAYLLVASMLLIPVGRLADTRGPIGYNLLGTAIFAIGSIMAGLAPNGGLMILGRCIQGAGGAFMFSTGAGIITAAFPPSDRGRALGLNVTAVYVGLTLGPVIGGLIVSHASWRWIFFINVPIALATILAGWTLLRLERRGLRSRERRHAPIDWTGAGLLGAALVSLFVPLTFSPLWGWGSAKTIVPVVLTAVFLVALVLVEDRVKEPMLDLDLLRNNRVFAAGNSAALLNYLAVFAVTTLTAVYLEIVQGLSPQQTGLLLLMQPVLMAVLSPFTGRLSDRVGSRILATTGMVLVALGMVQLAFASSSTGRVLAALATIGVGMAVFSAPNISAVMGSVDRSQLSLASGFLATMRFTGQGLSIAALGAIAAYKLGPAGGRVIFLGESSGASSVPAFADGYQAAMLVGAALALLGAVLSWIASSERLRPDRPGPGPDAPRDPGAAAPSHPGAAAAHPRAGAAPQG